MDLEKRLARRGGKERFLLSSSFDLFASARYIEVREVSRTVDLEGLSPPDLPSIEVDRND